jgi:hypothetical protein
MGYLFISFSLDILKGSEREVWDMREQSETYSNS